VINPVLGPEAITGSSRMKGGTATLAVLHAAFATGVSRAGLGQPSDPAGPGNTPRKPTSSAFTPVEAVQRFQRAASEAHASASHRDGTDALLAQAITLCADALRADKRVCYVGAGSAGLTGVIDASEMPDTYSAPFEQAAFTPIWTLLEPHLNPI